ncbi:Gfo/Idh/MocA family oxidoreductase [Paenibacillus doosanensis]|uniref:Gfo/Idh/MocA family protein n=1 Tax=Paenibacillus doosanensis TaxID=1229154 RepID=UPI002180656E|nr:Gfo/Idh/MocA family oxidoreductase [Paenibacillus doosanensis]MCS7462861.1 Gfo/Idh/MocA family oxidoreductase [Paenibacillus doosanensis]
MKAALIGDGQIGLSYARSLSKLRDTACWAGLCGVTDGEAIRLAEAAGSPVFRTYEEMMELAAPDIVCVCMPPHMQQEYVLKSIERGKHVFCEAPPAVDADWLKPAFQAAEAKGVCFLAGQAERFAPYFRDMKSKLDKGAIGAPGVVHIQRSAPYPAEAGDRHADAGAIRDGVISRWLPKDIFLLRWMLGEINTVYALNPRAPGVDYALVTLRFASGAIANIAEYWGDAERYRYRIELAGSEGVIRYDSNNTASIEVKRRNEAGDSIETDSPSVRSPYDEQLADVLRCIAENLPPIVATEDIVTAMNIAEAACISLETGMPVHLNGGERI